MVRRKKVGDNAEEGEDLKMLEIDEIIALLRLDGMELDLSYFVKDKIYTAYIEQPCNHGLRISVHCIGTGDTETEAANIAWSAYENSGRNHSVA